MEVEVEVEGSGSGSGRESLLRMTVNDQCQRRPTVGRETLVGGLVRRRFASTGAFHRFGHAHSYFPHVPTSVSLFVPPTSKICPGCRGSASCSFGSGGRAREGDSRVRAANGGPSLVGRSWACLREAFVFNFIPLPLPPPSSSSTFVLLLVSCGCAMRRFSLSFH